MSKEFITTYKIEKELPVEEQINIAVLEFIKFQSDKSNKKYESVIKGKEVNSVSFWNTKSENLIIVANDSYYNIQFYNTKIQSNYYLKDSQTSDVIKFNAQDIPKIIRDFYNGELSA